MYKSALSTNNSSLLLAVLAVNKASVRIMSVFSNFCFTMICEWFSVYMKYLSCYH